MSFLGWIASLAALPFTSIDAFSSNVWNAFRRQWSILVALFHSVVTAAAWFATAGMRLGSEITHTLSSLGAVFWWLTTSYVPSMVNGAFHTTMNAVRALNTDIRIWTSRLVHLTDVLLQRLIHNVDDKVGSALRWARTEIGKLWTLLGAVRDIVWTLLRDPRKLVAWILPVLWGPLWRFIEGRSVAIGRWFLLRAISGALGVAHIAEGVIARVL